MLYACRAMVKGKRNAQATVVFSILRIRSELCCLVACRLPAGNINFPRNFMMCDHVCVRPSLSLSLFLRLSQFRSLSAFTAFISVEICIFIIYSYKFFLVYARTFCVYTTCSYYKILTGKADYCFRMWATLQRGKLSCAPSPRPGPASPWFVFDVRVARLPKVHFKKSVWRTLPGLK